MFYSKRKIKNVKSFASFISIVFKCNAIINNFIREVVLLKTKIQMQRTFYEFMTKHNMLSSLSYNIAFC